MLINITGSILTSSFPYYLLMCLLFLVLCKLPESKDGALFICVLRIKQA